MAQQFNPLQLPRLAELHRRAFGEDLELGTMSPELVATIIHELNPQEWWLVKRKYAWTSQGISVLAAVAILGALIVTNPAGSGVIAICDTAGDINSVTASLDTVVLDPAAPDGASGPCTGFDTRIPLNGASQFGVPALTNATKRNAGAVSGAEIDRFQTVVGQDTYAKILPTHHAIVTPGHSIGIFHGTANETSRLVLAGYLYPARPEELAGSV